MSLLEYEAAFSRLNPNKAKGNVSPHKIAMLMAVMDLIESETIMDNQIFYSDTLLNAFTIRFDELKSQQDRNNPHLPFYHLRTEGFWHHQVKPGQRASYNQLTTASGPGAIRKHIAFAYLDDELFELLRNHVVRELLKSALYKNLEITSQRRLKMLEVDGWDWLECEACVTDYFAMVLKELHGEKYNKAEHRRTLMQKLNNRSEGSVEFKHQNISAVLVEMGFPYISGYKPRYNYQAQLKEVVLAHLAAHQNDIGNLAPEHVELTTPDISNWDKVLDQELPECIPTIVIPNRKYIARKPNYTRQEANNRRLGELGEQFVIGFEQYTLQKAGREDLAKEVEWSSKERGDGLGYDVRSFLIENGVAKEQERFIEIKTTNSGKYQPFFITDNELAFSKENSESYSLYRVYDFKARARLFQLTGAVDKFVNLKPELYRASFTL
ncbi:DUF3883 domain-containing protein [Pseudomonadota bacterium]